MTESSSIGVVPGGPMSCVEHGRRQEDEQQTLGLEPTRPPAQLRRTGAVNPHRLHLPPSTCPHPATGTGILLRPVIRPLSRAPTAARGANVVRIGSLTGRERIRRTQPQGFAESGWTHLRPALRNEADGPVSCAIRPAPIHATRVQPSAYSLLPHPAAGKATTFLPTIIVASSAGMISQNAFASAAVTGTPL